jgi:hypothetical protein
LAALFISRGVCRGVGCVFTLASYRKRIVRHRYLDCLESFQQRQLAILAPDFDLRSDWCVLFGSVIAQATDDSKVILVI